MPPTQLLGHTNVLKKPNCKLIKFKYDFCEFTLIHKNAYILMTNSILNHS